MRRRNCPSRYIFCTRDQRCRFPLNPYFSLRVHAVILFRIRVTYFTQKCYVYNDIVCPTRVHFLTRHEAAVIWTCHIVSIFIMTKIAFLYIWKFIRPKPIVGSCLKFNPGNWIGFKRIRFDLLIIKYLFFFESFDYFILIFYWSKEYFKGLVFDRTNIVAHNDDLWTNDVRHIWSTYSFLKIFQLTVWVLRRYVDSRNPHNFWSFHVMWLNQCFWSRA